MCVCAGDRNAEEIVDERLLIPFRECIRCNNDMPATDPNCKYVAKHEIGMKSGICTFVTVL